MPEPKVDYDAVARNYDLRTKEGYLSGIAAGLKELAYEVDTRRILDVERNRFAVVVR